jgi:hypothetical protein
MKIGDRVRVAGAHAHGGVIGTIGRSVDTYGRWGVVPEEPIYVRGKRGPKKAYEPIWVMPADLEPLLPIGAADQKEEP